MGTLCRTPHYVKPSPNCISLNLEAVPVDLKEQLFPDAEPSLLPLFASCGLLGSGHGPLAPLLPLQSELPGKVGSWGLQGVLCARGLAKGKDMEQEHHFHLWP